MCGIAGFSHLLDWRDPARGSTPFDWESGLRKATSALAHRGPDDEGIFTEPRSGVGLGHRRLSILDLSHLGHQPMVSEDGKAIIVFNGEIYNFPELRSELESEGQHFRSQTDTEVLLYLYQRDGLAMLPRLNGIFTFAIWDTRTGRMLVARDAYGVKPLYYQAGEGYFAFASEIKALRHLMPFPSRLDEKSLKRYMAFLWCPGEGTPWQDVRKVNPGEAFWIRDGKIEERVVWHRLPVFRIASNGMTEQQAIDGTVKRVREAVHRQLIADVPLGAFLSGGLDSSSITVFARERQPDLHCFTIELSGGQEAGLADDLPHARQVAAHLGVPLEVVTVDSSRMAADLMSMVVQLDEPLADPAALNVLYISRRAREMGIKVLLSGAGGDDLFTGYRRHRAVGAEAVWTWLPVEFRKRLSQVTGMLDKRRPTLRRLGKLFDGAALAGDRRLINYFLWMSHDDLLPLLSKDFVAALGAERAEQPMLEFLEKLPPSKEPLDRMLALEQRFFLADHNLIYTDKMSMAVGVETRVPYLDLELAEFAARIPFRFKQKGGESKWIFKKAMEPYLPRSIIYRPKSGFGAPLRRWIRFELRELLGDLLSEPCLRRRGLFEPHAVQQLMADNDKGKVDASYTLLSLICVELWCQHFLDQRPVRPLSLSH